MNQMMPGTIRLTEVVNRHDDDNQFIQTEGQVHELHDEDDEQEEQGEQEHRDPDHGEVPEDTQQLLHT